MKTVGVHDLTKDFKEFIRVSGMTHVRTSPNYPQSNGKIERWHKSLKTECVRPMTPLSLEDARRVVGEYVERYNTIRLHSAIGYITPEDKLAGREQQIFAERDRKLEAAREMRKARRQRSDIAYRQRDYGAQTGSRAPTSPSAAREPLTLASTVV